MRLTHFFIDRPIFATVVSVFITLIGGIAFFTLPLAQYPEIAPPTIVVSATYPGASGQTVSETVATPLEQQINGVENMLYMSSNSTGDGNLRLTITFRVGTNLDIAQVLVQNRVSQAMTQLPSEVQRQGVNVQKSSPDLMLVVHIYSPDGSRDQLYLSNYATLQMKDVLARLQGVGNVTVFGARDYSMRVWLDPDKVAARNLTAGEVVAAIQAQNIQVSAGVLNQPPVPTPGAFQVNLQTQGRLKTPEEFGNILIKSDSDGRITRVKDIARIELGAQDYNVNGYLDSQRAVPMGIFQLPGSNALDTAQRVLDAVDKMSASFPSGVAYKVVYNPTLFIKQSVVEVFNTIWEAVLLVVVVVIVFLQTWRASVVPIVAIPVLLVGTFAILSGLGYSLNNLSLFGLVLAVGIVVDDAIVVVENVERNIREGMSPRNAAHETMDEVGGALVAIALVLSAVFIPAAFIPGISGAFFKQFAATIASSTIISLIVSLTLSPALCALLFKPHQEHDHEKASPLMKPVVLFFMAFNRAFDKLSNGYGALTKKMIRITSILLAVYAGLMALAGTEFYRAPKGFIPDQDQGYLITLIQMPPGASLARTDAVVQRAVDIIMKTPGVAHVVPIAGLDAATFTNSPSAATVFVLLNPWEERAKEKGQSATDLVGTLRMRLGAIQEAMLIPVMPPPVRGIGSAGGWKMMVQDTKGRGLAALESAVQGMVVAGNQIPGLVNVFSTYNTRTPSVYADVDLVKAQILGVPVNNVYDVLRIYMGASYVNDFNYLGRTYRVMAQGDGDFRTDVHAVSNLMTRNNQGEMVPIGSVASFRSITGAYRVPRYNLYSAGEVQGATLPGYSSGYALEQMGQLARDTLPDGFSFEWTELALQEVLAGNNGILVFVASVVFVFLVLAAQYESWSLPLSVVLIVPMCLLAAVTGLNIRGISVNILAQVGFVVLIGLAAKNAILIVEFARQGENEGMDRFEAAVSAARTRLRPILMTSFAFILGVVPLVWATGAGAEMRQSLGSAVFFGMLGVTGFGLVFTPVFYVVVRGLVGWLNRHKPGHDKHPKPHPVGPGSHSAGE